MNGILSSMIVGSPKVTVEAQINYMGPGQRCARSDDTFLVWSQKTMIRVDIQKAQKKMDADFTWKILKEGKNHSEEERFFTVWGMKITR